MQWDTEFACLEGSIKPGEQKEEAFLQSTTTLALGAFAEERLFKEVTVTLPPLPQGGAVLRVTGCGLCGSDVEKLLHKTAQPGQVLGHEVVGVLEALHRKAPSTWQVGQRVVAAHHVPCGTCHYCLNQSFSMCRAFKQSNLFPGGFAQRLILSQHHLEHTTFAIPSHISDREASCVEPLACVIRAVERVPKINGKASAAIVGLGFIGLLAGQVFQQKGYQTLGIDTLASRCALANEMKATQSVYQAGGQDVSEKQRFLNEHTPTGGVDVVCLTVGNLPAWQEALSLVREGGSILVLANTPALPPNLGEALYYRELSIIPSYSPSLGSLQQAAAWVFERKVRLTPLVTHPIPWQAANKGLTAYLKQEAVKVFFSFIAG